MGRLWERMREGGGADGSAYGRVEGGSGAGNAEGGGSDGGRAAGKGRTEEREQAVQAMGKERAFQGGRAAESGRGSSRTTEEARQNDGKEERRGWCGLRWR
ncbi:MAG: hypothetical protein IMX05_02945 [Hydrogenibacillus schlegelii]|nr:hypothetical protein [Hydrogenibacillus schlegelii]